MRHYDLSVSKSDIYKRKSQQFPVFMGIPTNYIEINIKTRFLTFFLLITTDYNLKIGMINQHDNITLSK